MLKDRDANLPNIANLSFSDREHDSLVHYTFDNSVEVTEEEKRTAQYLGTLLDHRSNVDFFEGEPLRALRTLAFSNAQPANGLAVGAFVMAMENPKFVDDRVVGREVWEPILALLKSSHDEIPTLALRAVIELTFVDANILQVVKLGGMELVCNLLSSSNKNTQGNAALCVANLVSHVGNHARIIQCRGIPGIVQASRSNDVMTQRYCVRAFNGLAQSFKGSMGMIDAGVVPVLLQMLNKPDWTVKAGGASALCDIASRYECRRKLAQNETTVARPLLKLLESSEPGMSCAAAIAIANLSLEEPLSLEFMRLGVLKPLMRMAKSTEYSLFGPAGACILNLSITQANRPQIVKAGYVERALELLGYEPKERQENVAIKAARTIANLAAHGKETVEKLLDAGAVERFCELLPQALPELQLEMAWLFMYLGADNDDVPLEVRMKFPETLLPLTKSREVEVRLRYASTVFLMGLSMDNDTLLKKYWTVPQGGIQGCLTRFMRSKHPECHLLAITTLSGILGLEGIRWQDWIRRMRSLKSALIQMGRDILMDPLYRLRVDEMDDPHDEIEILWALGMLLAMLD
ncbi:Vacuolar protein 8 [Mortierella alpina]|uniref:Vacuolar protein 8 n=1 Tax=Mortierella alpina TaxID=64518 RepID=A0A9P6J8Z9_MORAP|nr:Vacuolar protein 8 [Mortierella alpina]